MGLKDWLFNNDSTAKTELTFGRFTDLYKPKSKYNTWDKAIEANIEEKPTSSYQYFLDYLNNEQIQNVEYDFNESGQMNFKFFQGSKIITGFTDDQYFTAEAKIAVCKKPNLTVFRSILEENYRLRYSKYCLDQNQNLTIVFQTSHLDANPYKLYYGLKELATIADHKDDALIKSFNDFEPINNGHVEPLPTYIVTAKFEYFTVELQKLKAQLNSINLSSNGNLGALVFLVASFAFKIDSLLLPEGVLMQRLEKIIDLCNEQVSSLKLQGVHAIIRELETLDKIKESDFKLEFYKSKYTFGVTNPVDHHHVVNMIEANMEQLKYYVGKKDEVMANAVCSYVFGKLMYDFALPIFDKELVLLYYQITESQYFSLSGISGYVKKGNINKSQVIQKIKAIEETAQETIKDIRFDHDLIMWDQKTFAPSYMYMILKSIQAA